MPDDDLTRRRLGAALAIFKESARELDLAWEQHRDGDALEGYPSYLPSFEEFTADLQSVRLRVLPEEDDLLVFRPSSVARLGGYAKFKHNSSGAWHRITEIIRNGSHVELDGGVHGVPAVDKLVFAVDA